MNHCGWCSTSNRARVIDALRADAHADTKALALRFHLGVHYVAEIRKKGRALGCLPKPACRCGERTPRGGKCGACGRRTHLNQMAAHNRWAWNPRLRVLRPYLLPPIGAAYVRTA